MTGRVKYSKNIRAENIVAIVINKNGDIVSSTGAIVKIPKSKYFTEAEKIPCFGTVKYIFEKSDAEFYERYADQEKKLLRKIEEEKQTFIANNISKIIPPHTEIVFYITFDVKNNERSNLFISPRTIANKLFYQLGREDIICLNCNKNLNCFKKDNTLISNDVDYCRSLCVCLKNFAFTQLDSLGYILKPSKIYSRIDMHLPEFKSLEFAFSALDSKVLVFGEKARENAFINLEKEYAKLNKQKHSIMHYVSKSKCKKLLNAKVGDEAPLLFFILNELNFPVEVSSNKNIKDFPDLYFF